MSKATRLIISTFLIFSIKSWADINSNESFFSKNQKFDKTGVELYNSNLDMKRHKKVGFGVALGGAGGGLGLNSELNLDPENALAIGLGAGPSYGSFNLLYKRNLESKYLSPYGKLGYSKWFSSSNSNFSVKDSDVLKRVFSDKELKSGRFDTDFLVSAVGVEYNQLEGDLAGVNFYGELVLLTEFKTASIIPTGAIGITYFY